MAKAVGLCIASACRFTSLTRFANPAVIIGRAISNGSAGIRPMDVPLFILCQLLGAIAAMMIFGWLFSGSSGSPTDDA